MANFRALGGGEVSASINDPNVLLNSSILQYPTITAGTDYSAGSTWYYKIGTRVVVEIMLKNLTANAENRIFVLPTGYRPVKEIHNGNNYSNITIGANGQVYSNGTTQYAMCMLMFDAFQ